MLRTFGAVIDEQFINPLQAEKSKLYKCPDCNKGIVLRSGQKRRPHFSHKEQCKNNIQIQLQEIKQTLETSGITINKQCAVCIQIHEIHIPPSAVELKNSSIMIYDNKTIKYILEFGYIKHDDKIEWFKLNKQNNQNTNNCSRKYICDECVQGQVYFNQRGAGCGKTYESIQLLNNPKFNNKTTFIYLTKTHSAKEVIYSELKEQYESKNINLSLISEEYTNKYKLVFDRCIIIIGTIDSFTYNMYDKSEQLSDLDLYNEIVNQIHKGKLTNEIKYANTQIKIDNKTLIIIDEAQDLGKNYMDAFIKIVEITRADLYIIGDKLQSIWGENNIYTCIDQATAKINKSDGINQVMRFHNVNFKYFVNTLIPYYKYNLPKIEKICDRPCKYVHEDIKPYTIFEMAPLYRTDVDDMYKVIDTIIGYIRTEIETYNYSPNNFMFIFPILKKNTFAEILYLKLDKFWKERLNSNEKWVYLHKSEPGTTINLKESVNATRIMSIHTSKGTGCEVVFVLGLSEHTLNIFSHKTDNITYNSLLHVAITRQKKAIYVGIENNNDEICRRFKKLL
jgi:hypothetical protein